MHELLRQYAAEKLGKEDEEREEVKIRHAQHYLALAEEANLELVGPQQAEWSSRIEREHDNIRAVMTGALERKDAVTALQMSASQFRFWYFRSYFNEGRRWFDAALALAESQPATSETQLLQARVLNAAGVFAREQGEYREAMALVQMSAELLCATGKGMMVAGALSNLGLNARDLGNYEQAEAYLSEAAELYRQRTDMDDLQRNQSIALALGNWGKVALWRGDLPRARSIVEESLASFREIKDTRGIALQTTTLGQIALEEGDYACAQSLFAEGLAIYRDVSDQRGVTDCLEGLAIAEWGRWNGVGEAQPTLERAAMLYGAACALRGKTGARLSGVDGRRLERMVVSVRQKLGDQEWSVALARGKAMTPEGAEAYALDGRVTS
jgi:tetratricopeptide (TPR) repeat protein